MKIISLAALLCGATVALAQSNEIALQFGKVVGEGRRVQFESVPGQVFAEDGGYSGGIVYNRQLFGFGFGTFHFHLPFFAFENKFDNDLIGTNTSRVTGFVTPGVQIRLFQDFPLQPYAFAGVGYARVARITPESEDEFRFENDGTWGVSAGGGLDILFGRNFGVRGEIRSLSTGTRQQVIPAGLVLDDPTTRWAATGGIVFRF
jgi:hypothetical protein